MCSAQKQNSQAETALRLHDRGCLHPRFSTSNARFQTIAQRAMPCGRGLRAILIWWGETPGEPRHASGFNGNPSAKDSHGEVAEQFFGQRTASNPAGMGMTLARG
jgi:hypothetical protein